MDTLQEISDYFDTHKLRLVTAESCTAGLVIATLGDMPGCGGWLEAGFVTYAPEAKCGVLGVNPETIEKYNLTSEPVAREMVEGALRNSRANVAVANTASPGRPAKTVFRSAHSAWHGRSSTRARQWCFPKRGISTATAMRSARPAPIMQSGASFFTTGKCWKAVRRSQPEPRRAALRQIK